jgi:hypothetical protein
LIESVTVPPCEPLFTLTDVCCVVLPPVPVHVRVYVYVPADAIGPIVFPVLDVGTLPLHPSDPEPPLAAQLVALAAFQVNVMEPPG